MEPEFWLERWEENRIGFHRAEVHPMLVKYASEYLKPESTALVPLCGKSLDMLWLAGRSRETVGVELSKKAANDFFKENSLSSRQEGAVFQGGGVRFIVGDFFAYQPDEAPDFIYDRAALIALPPEMRSRYAEKIASIASPETRILLISFYYPQEEMNGPPFSVSPEEIQSLYGEHFSLELLEDRDLLPEEPRFAEAGLSMLREQCRLLKRK